jgi:phosphatidylserine/phosphatidylglycerophosphate/cardiolipin synthase-like enzyme
VYDRTQMQEVLSQWRVDPHASWKAPVFTSIVARLPFASKVTTPYAPGSVHDYMHAKVTVVDDVVLTGSYNLSHSGEDNAENLVELKNSALANVFARFVDGVFDRYSGSSPTGQAPK